MPSIRVTHSIGGLARDCAVVATGPRRDLPKVVKRNVKEGEKVAQRIARGASGIHGINYWKRITSEMTGPLSGEYGPHGEVIGNAVGGGWRHGTPNTDLEKSLDVIGPKYANEVGETAQGWFWP